jgi:hypothetical protein
MQTTSQLRTASEETNKMYITYISLWLSNWFGVVKTRPFRNSVVEDSVLLLVSSKSRESIIQWHGVSRRSFETSGTITQRRRDSRPSKMKALPSFETWETIAQWRASLDLWILRTYDFSKRREPLPSDTASLDPRRWRHYPLSKRGKSITQWHGVSTPLKMKALRSFETSGTNYPVTWRLKTPENIGITLIRNAGNWMSNDAESFPRRMQSRFGVFQEDVY